MWFKSDDQLAFHPKVIAAGNTAMGLWIRAGTWSSAQLTDGFIPATLLPSLGAKKTDAERLVTVGLWEHTEGGYRFHDWSDHNPSREVVEQMRADKAGAATVANHNRWHKQRGVKDIKCPHCRSNGATG